MTPDQLNPDDYAAYYSKYIEKVPNEDLLELLETSGNNLLDFVNAVPEESHDYAYAEGKWTLKEILLHLIDTERILSYRALRFARNDKTDLPGFEQDDYVGNSFGKGRTIAGLLEEYIIVRQATIALFKSFNEEVLRNGGIASNNFMSVGAVGFVICGHEMHHMLVYEKLYLNEEYI